MHDHGRASEPRTRATFSINCEYLLVWYAQDKLWASAELETLEYWNASD